MDNNKKYILVWVNSDQEIFNEVPMNYEEAYKLMKIRAVTHWMVSQCTSVEIDDETIERVSHLIGIYISAYSASVWINPEDICSWKIIEVERW